MLAKTQINTIKKCPSLQAKGGKPKWDEVEAMRNHPACLAQQMTEQREHLSNHHGRATHQRGQHSSGSHRAKSRGGCQQAESTRVATGPRAVVALEGKVGGLHRVGNPCQAKDNGEGLLLEAIAKLETSRSWVTATKRCMIPIQIHRGAVA